MARPELSRMPDYCIFSPDNCQPIYLHFQERRIVSFQIQPEKPQQRLVSVTVSVIFVFIILYYIEDIALPVFLIPAYKTKLPAAANRIARISIVFTPTS